MTECLGYGLAATVHDHLGWVESDVEPEVLEGNAVLPDPAEAEVRNVVDVTGIEERRAVTRLPGVKRRNELGSHCATDRSGSTDGKRELVAATAESEHGGRLGARHAGTVVDLAAVDRVGEVGSHHVARHEGEGKLAGDSLVDHVVGRDDTSAGHGDALAADIVEARHGGQAPAAGLDDASHVLHAKEVEELTT